MDDIWDTKLEVELTIKELEDIGMSLRFANAFSGNSNCELEDKINNIVQIAKISI